MKPVDPDHPRERVDVDEDGVGREDGLKTTLINPILGLPRRIQATVKSTPGITLTTLTSLAFRSSR